MIRIKEIRKRLGLEFEGEPKENEAYYRIGFVQRNKAKVERGSFRSNKHESTEDLSFKNIFFKLEEAEKVAGAINVK